MAYENPEHARVKRTPVYLSHDEYELLSDWAKMHKQQKAALMRSRLVELAKKEIERYKLRERMICIADKKLSQSA